MIELTNGGRLIATLAAAVALLGAGGMALAQSTPGAETASLQLTVRTCPAGYDPTAADIAGNYLEACREPAGDTLFRVAQGEMQGPSASTGTSGDQPQESTVEFSGLTPGRHTITAEAPSEIASGFVGACTSDARDLTIYPFLPYARVEAGTLTVELQPGETLSCDWYQVKS